MDIVYSVDLFMKRVSPEPNSGCWLWIPRSLSGGSSCTVYINGRARDSKVVAYLLFRGDPPPGTEVNRMCGTPCCVNPDHLLALTYKEKTHRSVGVRNNWRKDPAKVESWKKNMATTKPRGPRKKTLSRTPISEKEMGLIYGTLLGDSSIAYPTNLCTGPRLYGNHGPKQREWVEFKAQSLPSLNISISEAKNGGYGEWHVRYRSCVHLGLTGVISCVKSGGRSKLVTDSWLEKVSEEGMAWWYMDDGSISYTGSSPSVNLHTHGFSHEEQIILKEWLARKGFYASITDSGRGHEFLRLSAASSRLWINRLRHYSIQSMAYKFRLAKRPVADGMQGRLRINDFKRRSQKRLRKPSAPKVTLPLVKPPIDTQESLF